MGTGMGIIPWLAIPERLFVELYPFRSNPAKYHGAQPSVTHRQGLVPVGSRLFVPEPEFIALFTFHTAT
jgi:hypothetical protein